MMCAPPIAGGPSDCGCRVHDFVQNPESFQGKVSEKKKKKRKNMADLIPPHGGLTEPVDRTVPVAEVAAFKSAAASLPKVPVSAADLSTVYRLADGTLSPLTGPMSSAVYNKVLDEAHIVHNGKKYAWTIPLAFPVTEAVAKT